MLPLSPRGAQHVGTILAYVFVSHGRPNPVPRMRDGVEAAVRLYNWNALAPHLATFGIDLSSDDKALIVAGGAPALRCASQRVRHGPDALSARADTVALTTALHALRTRAGACGVAPHPLASAHGALTARFRVAAQGTAPARLRATCGRLPRWTRRARRSTCPRTRTARRL